MQNDCSYQGDEKASDVSKYVSKRLSKGLDIEHVLHTKRALFCYFLEPAPKSPSTTWTIVSRLSINGQQLQRSILLYHTQMKLKIITPAFEPGAGEDPSWSRRVKKPQ